MVCEYIKTDYNELSVKILSGLLQGLHLGLNISFLLGLWVIYDLFAFMPYLREENAGL